MKDTRHLHKIAMKLSAAKLAQLRIVAMNALGGREIYTEPGLSVYELPENGILEMYGPGSSYPGYLFEKNSTVVTYNVPDIAKAIAEATVAGMEVICNQQQVCPEFPYCYIRDDEGNIFGLKQENKL